MPKCEEFEEALQKNTLHFASNPDQLAWAEKLKSFWELCASKFNFLKFYQSAALFLDKDKLLVFSAFSKKDNANIQIPNQTTYKKIVDIVNVFTDGFLKSGQEMYDALFGESQRTILDHLKQQNIEFNANKLQKMNKLLDDGFDKINALESTCKRRCLEFMPLQYMMANLILDIKRETKSVEKISEPTMDSFERGNERIEQIMPDLENESKKLIEIFNQLIEDFDKFTEIIGQFFNEFNQLLSTNDK